MTSRVTHPARGGRLERQEIGRKGIHLAASIGAALSVLNTAPTHGRVILAAAVTIALTIEVMRQVSPKIDQLFQRAFKPMLRRGEEVRLTGATTLAIGFLAAALIAPPAIAAMAILMAGTGDAAGALIGQRFGNRRIRGKSLEGSAACLITAAVAGSLVPGASPIPILASALIMTIIEAVGWPSDDNLILAPLTALSLLAFSALS